MDRGRRRPVDGDVLDKKNAELSAVRRPTDLILNRRLPPFVTLVWDPTTRVARRFSAANNIVLLFEKNCYTDETA